MRTEGQVRYFQNSKIQEAVYTAVRGGEFYEFVPTTSGTGFYFSSRKEIAESYSPEHEVYEVYLNLENPLVIDAEGGFWSDLPEPEGYEWQVEFTTWMASEWAKEKGYDGAIIRNVRDSGTYSRIENTVATTYIAFESSQIKLTSNENPTDSKDIRK